MYSNSVPYKGPSYGLSRQCQLKTMAKFDLERAIEALSWIEEIIGRTLEPNSIEIKDYLDVVKALKDGTALCEVINTLNPGAVKKINKSSLAFKQMENIEVFLKACRSYGMKEMDVFQTQDLYEGKSVYTVINSLHSLGSLARKNGFKGPTIGVKLADENVREFTQEQLAEGQTIIGLQYGTNRGASQKGMAAYGMQRKM